VILLIDNYDSFVHNLARYFQRLGQETLVVRNDALDAHAARRLRPHAVVLSPGPCTPTEAGCSLDIVRTLHEELPILGVCLGHQTIAAALGARVVRARQPMHGRTSFIRHDGQGVFAGAPQPLRACRYHSLIVDETSLPACLAANDPHGIGLHAAGELLAHGRHRANAGIPWPRRATAGRVASVHRLTAADHLLSHDPGRNCHDAQR
jgi:anthranilate synthase/aminodeoxychorismate synthase-like glutamine amidotransferase